MNIDIYDDAGNLVSNVGYIGQLTQRTSPSG